MGERKLWRRLRRGVVERLRWPRIVVLLLPLLLVLILLVLLLLLALLISWFPLPLPLPLARVERGVASPLWAQGRRWSRSQSLGR